MKAPLALLVVLSCCIHLHAQEPATITITAGSKISDVMATTDILYYPQFMPGKVLMKDGAQAEARLNYNALFDEVHFIDAKGDTLALADEQNTKWIAVGRDTFYYEKGFVRQLAANAVVKLAVKEAWVSSDSRLAGSFNTSGATSAISTYTSYHAAGSRYGLTVNEDVTIRKARHYFLGGRYNRFVPASKKGLMQLFPKLQRQIEAYLKAARTDFNQQEDLEKLIQAIADF